MQKTKGALDDKVEGLDSSAADARHWNKYVLKVFEENADTLSALFNG